MNRKTTRFGWLFATGLLFGSIIVALSRPSSALTISNVTCTDPNGSNYTCEKVVEFDGAVLNRCTTSVSCTQNGGQCLESHPRGNTTAGWWTHKTKPAGGSAHASLFCMSSNLHDTTRVFRGVIKDGDVKKCHSTDNDNYNYTSVSYCGAGHCCNNYCDVANHQCNTPPL
jgi:hypothetical protein